MMQRVFDSSFNFIGEVDDFKSLIVTRKYRGIEFVEITIPYSSINVAILQKNNWLWTGNKKMFRILARTISDDPLMVKIVGYSLAKLLDGRLRNLAALTAEQLFNSYTAGLFFPETLTNIIPNGNFVDATGWTIGGAPRMALYSDDYKDAPSCMRFYKETAGSTTGIGTVHRSVTGLTNGDIIFICGWYRASADSLLTTFYASDAAGIYTNRIFAPAFIRDGTWRFISLLKTVSDNGFCVVCGSTSTNSVKETLYDCITAINLTAEFGPGNEPTQEYCEELMSHIPLYWFNGIYSPINYRDVIVKSEITAAITSIGNNIPFLECASVKTFGTPASINPNTIDILLRAMDDILAVDDIGYFFEFDADTKKITYDSYIGFDRTATNGVLPPVIFSPEMDNILTREYTESSVNTINHITAFGSADSFPRPIGTAGTAVDADRVASFSDERSEEDIDKLSEKAEQALVADVVSYKATINPVSNLIYEEDYDLGDIVTLRDLEMGVTLDARIVEAKEIYQEGKPDQLELIFGNSVPTILNSIRAIDRATVQTRTGV